MDVQAVHLCSSRPTVLNYREVVFGRWAHCSVAVFRRCLQLGAAVTLLWCIMLYKSIRFDKLLRASSSKLNPEHARREASLARNSRTSDPLHQYAVNSKATLEAKSCKIVEVQPIHSRRNV